MHAITQGNLERAICDLGNHFGIDFDGMTNRECIDKLRELCPRLHSQEELQEFVKTLLQKIVEEYGFLGLRVWFSCNMKGVILLNELIAGKYFKLNDEIKSFVDSYREEQGIILALDVFIAVIELKQFYKQEYGVLDEKYSKNIYSVLKTIHLTHYNDDVIDSVNYLLPILLSFAGDKYYQCKDLTDKNVLKELYTYVGEELGDDDLFEGHMLFHEYDGYGGSHLCSFDSSVGDD